MMAFRSVSLRRMNLIEYMEQFGESNGGGRRRRSQMLNVLLFFHRETLPDDARSENFLLVEKDGQGKRKYFLAKACALRLDFALDSVRPNERTTAAASGNIERPYK